MIGVGDSLMFLVLIFVSSAPGTLSTSIPTVCQGFCLDPNYVWDIATCSCIFNPSVPKPSCFDIECEAGYEPKWYFDECSCVKINCPPWKIYEAEKCICKIPEPDCEDDSEWDEEFCHCLPVKPSCDLICQEPQMLDEFTCTCVGAPPCVLPMQCLPGYILDPKCMPCAPCKCIVDPNYVTEAPCIVECPLNYDLDEINCECNCIKKTCPMDYVFNMDLCKCKEFCDKECPIGYELDMKGCSCNDCPCVPEKIYQPGCDPRAVKCGLGHIFDTILCRCVKEIQPLCDDGYIYDKDSCSCICAKCFECPKNFVWNENICQCICPRNQNCPKDFILDLNTCNCVCDTTKKCPEGFALNPESCNCGCVQNEKCKEGYIWDDLTCKCTHEATPTCDPGFIYDHEQCKCVCEFEVVCRPPKVFDDKICNCVCLRKHNEYCPERHWNENSCQCILPLKL